MFFKYAISVLTNADPFDPNLSDRLPTALELQIAAVVLLYSVASVDGDFADEERRQIIEELRAAYGLTEDKASKLIKIAEQGRKENVDIDPFARTLDRYFQDRQKSELVTMIWKVVLADKRIEKCEAELAAEIRILLGLSLHQSLHAAGEAAPRPRTPRRPRMLDMPLSELCGHIRGRRWRELI